MERDGVDEKLEILGRELPQIDLPTEGIVQRIQKLAWRLNRSLNDGLTTERQDPRLALA